MLHDKYAAVLSHLFLLVVLNYLIHNLWGYELYHLRVRMGGIVSLNEIRTELDDGLHLLRGLNALCQRLDVVGRGEFYYILDEMLSVWVCIDPCQKHSVYLHILRHIPEKIVYI